MKLLFIIISVHLYFLTILVHPLQNSTIHFKINLKSNILNNFKSFCISCNYMYLKKDTLRDHDLIIICKLNLSK